MSAHERERLAGYLDGELSSPERAEVEAHLATCEECASLLAEMGAVDAVARGLSLEAPSGYFETLPGRVRARIEAKNRPRERTDAAHAGWRLPVWAWAAAAALLLAVVTPLTLPSLYRARTTPRERPVTAAPMPEAIVPPPQSAGERLAAGPADDAAGPPAKREVGRGRRSAPAAPPEPAPMARARPGEGDVAAPAVAEVTVPELRKDAPARAGVATQAAPVAVEGESLEEAPAVEPDRDRRQAAMADAMPSRASPATLGRAEAPKAGAPAPQAAEAFREGFATAERKSAVEEDAVAFRRLTREVPGGAAAWREYREKWRSFVADYPDSRHVDEARVRAIEAGLEAWRAGGDAEDLARARADAEAYLARDDAQLKARVRRALETVESR
ncbi:MAG: zf-HC2 domain-containing protein [Acidobacteriota bacterium]|jgi:hypothetical protein